MGHASGWLRRTTGLQSTVSKDRFPPTSLPHIAAMWPPVTLVPACCCASVRCTLHLQACILRKVLKTGHSISPDNLPELRIILHDTLLAAENLTPPFMRALARQGWQTEKIVVEAHRRRARW